MKAARKRKTSHVNPVLSRQGITDSFEREADKVNLSHFCIVPEVDIGELGNPSGLTPRP